MLTNLLLQVSSPVSVPYVFFVGSMLTVTVLSFSRTFRQGIRYLKTLHDIPCHSCAYFTNNYCLKCTVHPSRALTEEAIACADYEPASRAMTPCSQNCNKQCPWDRK